METIRVCIVTISGRMWKTRSILYNDFFRKKPIERTIVQKYKRVYNLQHGYITYRDFICDFKQRHSPNTDLPSVYFLLPWRRRVISSLFKNIQIQQLEKFNFNESFKDQEFQFSVIVNTSIGALASNISWPTLFVWRVWNRNKVTRR